MRHSFRFLILSIAVVAAMAVQAAVPAPPPLLNGLVRGVITDVKGPNITIMHSVVVDTGNATVTRRGKSQAAGDLQPGTRVTITVSTTSPNKPGVLLADKIVVDQSEAVLSGPLEAVGNKSVTVLGQQIRVADDTFFTGFVDGSALQSASGLKVGYPVDVEILPDANGPVALSVTAIGPSPRAPQPPPVNHDSITGAVTAINDQVWTVAGIRVYAVDKKTVITGNPAVGDTVHVEGLKTPDGAIIAGSIAKQ